MKFFDGVTKNIVVNTDYKIFCIHKTDDSGEYKVTEILPQITDVREIENKDTMIVIVDFADGTTEKAVLSWEDEYSFEQGVSVCITKKLLSKCVNGQGSSLYNKLIKHAVRVHDTNREMEEEEINRQLEEEGRKIRQERKNREKRERRRRREKERQIEIQKEAYKRALTEYALGVANNNGGSYKVTPEAEAEISPELPEEPPTLTF